MFISQLDCRFEHKFIQNKPSNQNYLFPILATELRRAGGPRTIKKLINKRVIPLPGISTCQKKFSFIYCLPGYLYPTLAYFNKIQDQLTPNEKYIWLCFDEVHTAYKGDLHPKLDMWIGPHKECNVLWFRSLTNLKIRFPLYLEFDKALELSTYMEIVCTVEAINLLVFGSTCDGGPKNIGKLINMLIN